MLELAIEDSTLLIDLDNWSACVIMDDTIASVVLNCVSLVEEAVSRVSSWHLVLMSDRAVWIDKSICSCHVLVTVRIVHLREGVWLKWFGVCLVFPVFSLFVLRVEAIAWVQVTAETGHLKLFQLLNRLSVTLDLAVKPLSWRRDRLRLPWLRKRDAIDSSVVSVLDNFFEAIRQSICSVTVTAFDRRGF